MPVRLPLCRRAADRAAYVDSDLQSALERGASPSPTLRRSMVGLWRLGDCQHGKVRAQSLRSRSVGRHIRLTQDRPAQSGWLWSRLVSCDVDVSYSAGSSLRAWLRLSTFIALILHQPLSPSAYEIEVEFKIDGKGVNLYGDGFALWLTRSRAQMGPVFGSSGSSSARSPVPDLRRSLGRPGNHV